MKLYIAAGQYVGTQAEAKKLDREFREVDVPTDKPGLISYLNAWARQPQEDQFETVVERQDPPTGLTPGAPTFIPPAVDLDELFMAAPLTQQLTLAAIAVEDARRQLRPQQTTRLAAAIMNFGPDDGADLIDDASDLFS